MSVVIDNFLPAAFAKCLKDDIESIRFPWHFCENTINAQDNKSQFAHSLYADHAPASPYYNIFCPILYFIEKRFKVTIEYIAKIKINLLPQTDISKLYTPHVDIQLPGYTTFVYYVNDSDGDTILYNEFITPNSSEYYHTSDEALTLYKKITPKYNSIVRFDSTRFHAYYTPVTNKRRIVFNIVLKLQ